MICAVLLVVAALANYQGHKPSCPTSAESHASYAYCERGNPSTVGSKVEAPPRNPRPSRNEYRDEADLQAQRDMAVWAQGMFWVSVAGSLIALVGVVLVARTLTATRDANRGFVSAAHRQLRAYISVESVSGRYYPGSPDAGSIRFELTVKIKNCGQTPAKSVMRIMEVFPCSPHTMTPIDKNGGSERIGLSVKGGQRLDIGPGQIGKHAYEGFFARYDATAVRTVQGGIEIAGTIEYSDYSGLRWRVPYKSRANQFPASRAGWRELEFGEIEQSEEERVDHNRKERPDHAAPSGDA